VSLVGQPLARPPLQEPLFSMVEPEGSEPAHRPDDVDRAVLARNSADEAALL